MSFNRVSAVLIVMKRGEQTRPPLQTHLNEGQNTTRTPTQSPLCPHLSAGIGRPISTFHPNVSRRPAGLTQLRVQRTRVILIRPCVIERSNLTSLAARAPFQFPGNLILSLSPFLIIAWEKETEGGGWRGDNKLCLLI